MAKYLIKASYSAEGAKGLMKEGGTSRVEQAAKLVEGIGGSMECFYFAFGEHDAYIIADMPNEVSATAVGLTVNSTGLVATSTTALITAEQVDAACDKAATLGYRPPGK
jgi:uncharacterized protein with GYD domain